MYSQTLSGNLSGLGAGLDLIENTLTDYKFKPKYRNEAMLISEECMVRLIDKMPEGENFQISIHKGLGAAVIKIVAPGKEFRLAESADYGYGFNTDGMDRDMEIAIRNMVLQSFAEKVKVKYQDGYNTIRITAGEPNRQIVSITLITFLISIILGLGLMYLIPQEAAEAVDYYLLSPIKTAFLHMFELILIPVIFFSIISVTSQFTSFSGSGKIGVKIIGSYLITSVAACLIGMGVFRILQPSNISMESVLMSQTITQAEPAGEMSVFETIVDIIPTNILTPFIESNSVQVIFMALICGIAVGMIGDYSMPLKQFFEACNTLFYEITRMISRVIPIAVFCFTTSLIMKTGIGILIPILQIIGILLIGMVCLVGFYCVFMMLFARLNPLRFLVKYAPHIQKTFKFGPNSEVMPQTMRLCKRSLGISPKLYSFSIPMGSTLNMDGQCIYLAIVGLFLAGMCDVQLFGSDIATIVFTIVLLSAGAPNQLCSGLICLAILIGSLGVSMDAIGVIMGINFIMEMMLNISNVMGDVVITLVVAKTEKLLDTEVYKKKKKRL